MSQSINGLQLAMLVLLASACGKYQWHAACRSLSLEFKGEKIGYLSCTLIAAAG